MKDLHTTTLIHLLEVMWFLKAGMFIFIGIWLRGIAEKKRDK